LRRPVPPSNFRSSGDTAEDLRRIRQHQQEILDWIDNQIDAIPAPVAGVTSFNTRTGAVLPVAGDYTKSDVGLSAVTNDAQLKRADNDWSGFTTQTGAPAAGDKFLIERSSDSAKRVMLASSLGSVYGVRDAIWDRPTTGSADDEEFDTDFLAAGTGGWKLALNGSLGTAMTRDGALDLTQAITSGHYRSSCIGSTLYIQLRQNEGCLLWKQLAGAVATHQLWFLGMGTHFEVGTANANDAQISIQILKDTGGNPDFNNRAFIVTGTSADRYFVQAVTGGVAGAALATNTLQWGMLDGLALRVNHASAAAGNFGGFGFRRNGAVLTANSSDSTQFNASTTKIAIGMQANTAQPVVSGVNNAIFALHFLRRAPMAGGWIAQS
jgi:hypothetical protein